MLWDDSEMVQMEPSPVKCKPGGSGDPVIVIFIIHDEQFATHGYASLNGGFIITSLRPAQVCHAPYIHDTREIASPVGPYLHCSAICNSYGTKMFSRYSLVASNCCVATSGLICLHHIKLSLFLPSDDYFCSPRDKACLCNGGVNFITYHNLP